MNSDTFLEILELVSSQDFKISEHGLQELMEDSLSVREIVMGAPEGIVVEDNPEYGKGPCVLVLQSTSDGRPVHVLWGMHKGTVKPAVLITAYLPDPLKWSKDFTRRIT